MTEAAATETIAPPPVTPFDRIGGHVPIRRMVDRFYDLMDSDPGFAELRAMHGPDLTPMRASLAGFLAAWMGGPRDWFDEHPGKCMMSAHAPFRIGDAVAMQWVEAMRRAAQDIIDDPPFIASMTGAFQQMATNMARASDRRHGAPDQDSAVPAG